jgi:hypothetical protein
LRGGRRASMLAVGGGEKEKKMEIKETEKEDNI